MTPKQVAVILAEISQLDIKKAISEAHLRGAVGFRQHYGFGPARSYFLIDGGERFDSKAIVGAAAQFVQGSSGRPLRPRDFHGGDPIKKRLGNLGFQVWVEGVGSLALPNDVADQEPFDPKNIKDARERIRRTIVQRRGQAKFRNALLEAYGSRCAISGCGALEVLEAAHICPYQGSATNHVTNGLLLRADIHTLFD